MLRRLGVRGKVLAALLVPVLVLFALAGTLTWQALREVQVAGTVTDLLGLLQESRTVSGALQAERRVSAEFVAGQGPTQEAVAEARTLTEESIARFGRAVDRVDLDNLADTTIPSLITTLQQNWTAVDEIRGRIDGGTAGYRVVIDVYATTIDQTIGFPSTVADQFDDRPLAAIVSAAAEVRQLAENYHREQVAGDLMLSGARGQVEILALAAQFPVSRANHANAISTVNELGLGENVVVPTLGASRQGIISYEGHRSLVATGSAVNFGTLTSEQWTEAAAAEIEALDQVQEQLRQAAASRAGSVSGAAVRTTVFTAAFALAAIIVSIVFALSVARQIVTPLRRLTGAAGQVREELPRLVEQVAIPGQGPDLSLTQIPVTSRDEIGQLAQAFNDVNATTIAVAQEQAALRGSIAEMFVNVARRDQILLNRQLSFIDALERSEEDPRVLADLFRLDHLATRMRRNSESLLVLAGIDSGRRVRETLPISDVVRTASSEIEHYERIQLDLPVDPMMLGHTVLPAAHMLAELLENATEFSEPGTPVHVSTGLDDEAVIIAIFDDGLGMTPVELAEANEKISESSAGDVLGSQRLGLHVVGRIASRLGADVRLTPGPEGRGTLATVRLPLVLFIDTAHLPHVEPNVLRSGQAQTFLRPDEAAGMPSSMQDATLGAPGELQDVTAGSVGSFENPAAPVDVAALTDGATDLGLPRRRADVDARAQQLEYRQLDDEAARSSIPLAPRVEDLLDAAGETVDAWQPEVLSSAPLPSRRADGPPAGEWMPEQVQADLPVRRTEEPAGGGLPTRRPAGGEPGGQTTAGLPTRTPSGPTPTGSMPIVPPAAATSAQPATAEGRAAMFSGFRSRRAELAAASLHVEPRDPNMPGPDADQSDRIAAQAAERAAFFSRAVDRSEPRPEPQPEPEPDLVIPSLEDLSDQPAWSEPAGEPEAPTAADPVGEPVAEHVAEQPWTPSAPTEPGAAWAPSPWTNLPAEASPSAVWEPTPAAEAIPAPEPAPATPPMVPTLEPIADEPWSADAPGAVPLLEPLGEQPVPAPEPFASEPFAPEPFASEPYGSEPFTPEPVAEPVGTAAAPWQAAPEAADPVAAEPVESYAPVAWGADAVAALASPPAFESIVGGDSAPKPKRRGLFGRLRGKRTAEAAPAPAPVPSPVPSPMPMPLPAPVATPADPGPAFPQPAATPARQSAFARPDEPEPFTGRHRKATPVDFVPGADPIEPVPPVPPAPVAPAAQAWAPAPPAYEPPPAYEAPPTYEQPAATYQAPAFEPPASPFSAAPTAPALPATPPEPAPPPPPPPATPAGPAVTSFVPQAGGPGATSFTPQSRVRGAMDDEVTSLLAQRADIAQQALSELSQLSSYRPQRDTQSAETLARRTPGTIPAAPEIERKPEADAAPRDANKVRDMLSSFHSGARRGRAAEAVGSNGASETSETSETSPEPTRTRTMTEPNPDPNPGSASW